MRIRFPSTLSEFSADSSTSSGSLARKARKKEFSSRQKSQKKAKKPRARDEHHETRQERAKRGAKRTLTPEERVAERARRKAKVSGSRTPFPGPASAEANPTLSEQPSSPIKRGLYFIYNNFVPHFGLSNDSPTPTGSFSNAPGAYPSSFVHPEPVPQSSSVIGSDEDSSDDSWSPSGTSSDSASYTSSNGSSSDLPSSDDLPTDIPEPSCHRQVSPHLRCKHHFADPYCRDRFNQERAKVARAEKYAREQEERRQCDEKQKQRLERERVRLEKERQEEERIRLEKARQEEEERQKHEQQQREEERRTREADEARDVREALEAYEAAKVRRREQIRNWMEADRQRRERLRREEEAQRAQREENRKRQKAAREEEEERKRREAFNARPRDRTSRTRSTHSRSHPYARSAKLGRTHSGLHFNPSSAPPVPAAKAVDPLVAHFEWYEAEWKGISSLSSDAPLSFASIPWPLLTIPRSPTDITTTRVLEFMRHAKRGPKVTTSKQLRLSAMKELKNWHSDKFTTRVLSRIVDDAEREIVRAAADIVQKALTDLKSSN